MRRRGRIFKDFRPVEANDDVVKALGRINENLKLILELLCDLRINTSNKPVQEEEQKENESNS